MYSFLSYNKHKARGSNDALFMSKIVSSSITNITKGLTEQFDQNWIIYECH